MPMITTPEPKAAAPTFRVRRYPASLIERLRLADGRSVLVRPVLPQDAELQRAFVRSLSPLARYRRFHGPLAELPEALLRELCEVDYGSHLALIGVHIDALGNEVQVAEARWVRHEAPGDPSIAEFAIAVADRWQRAGLGSQLLRLLIRSAAAAGLRQLRGNVLTSNPPMYGLLLRSGWRLRGVRGEPELLVARYDLAPARPAANETFAALAA
jgi:acetyltransferase